MPQLLTEQKKCCGATSLVHFFGLGREHLTLFQKAMTQSIYKIIFGWNDSKSIVPCIHVGRTAQELKEIRKSYIDQFNDGLLPIGVNFGPV